jgi:hypothetical protein
MYFFFVLVILAVAIGVKLSRPSVSKVMFVYSTENPTMIVFVDFDITPATSKASVSLVAGAALTDCELTAYGTHAHCPMNVSVSDVDDLRIVIGE